MSGKVSEESWGIGIGFGHQPQHEPAPSVPVYEWKFDTDEIKQPLYDFLEQHGWHKAPGLLGKLFGKK